VRANGSRRLGYPEVAQTPVGMVTGAGIGRSKFIAAFAPKRLLMANGRPTRGAGQSSFGGSPMAQAALSGTAGVVRQSLDR
jgi:hypothetical protein